MFSKRKNYNKQLSEDCWNLDSSFYKWLKERLPIFVKESNIDLTFHTFDIAGETLTQKEVIQRMMKNLDILTAENADGFSPIYEKAVEDLMECWSKVITAMWW